MKRTFVLAGLLVFGCAVLSYAEVKCEANINGFKIHTVYIMGGQYNGVVWAYKHIAEETCLTPSTDLSKADAILEVHRTWTPGSKADTAPLTFAVEVSSTASPAFTTSAPLTLPVIPNAERNLSWRSFLASVLPCIPPGLPASLSPCFSFTHH